MPNKKEYKISKDLIAKKMVVPINSVKRNPKNMRRHKKDDLEAIAIALSKYGQQTPIVVDTTKIIRKGNGTHEAAAKILNWTHIAVTKTDITERDIIDLYSLSDNRTGELSTWDVERLSKSLQRLDKKFDLPALGLWQDFELAPLLNADWTPPTPHPETDDEGKPYEMAQPVQVTVEQRATFNRAMEKLRIDEQDDAISEGRCLELICASFLS